MWIPQVADGLKKKYIENIPSYPKLSFDFKPSMIFIICSFVTDLKLEQTYSFGYFLYWQSEFIKWGPPIFVKKIFKIISYNLMVIYFFFVDNERITNTVWFWPT